MDKKYSTNMGEEEFIQNVGGKLKKIDHKEDQGVEDV
jgi:hypothetical protein